jgi:hypothetical protein
MGRGRAKAKQTKVARELKYASGDLDINRLTAELSGSGHDHGSPSEPAADDADDADDLGYGDAGLLDEDSSRR